MSDLPLTFYMNKTTHHPSGNFLSKASLTLSSVCLIHCLAMPFVILLLPAISQFMSETVETVLILAVIPISAIAFVPTWLKHKNFRLGGIFLFGLTVILIGQFGMDHHHDFLSNTDQHEAILGFVGRTTVLMIGVFSLAWATYRNNKHTHVCKNPHHHH
jgi:hypothetical protein